MKIGPLACLLATVSVLPAVLGDDGPRRRVIEQKSALVQRVLADSPMAQRVAAGGSQQAKAYLADAAERYRRAQALATEGHLAASESAIDEAMVLIGRARQIAPDRLQRESELRARYAALLESTQGMLASARRQAARGAAGAQPQEIARGAELIDRSVELAGGDRFEEAHRLLLAAERELLAGLTHALGSTTLDYTMRFDSPADEFRHEAERFSSFQRLVPIALSGLKPGPAAARMTDEYLDRGLQLRRAAENDAGRGELGVALDRLREGIVWLQRALAAAGLALPAAQ